MKIIGIKCSSYRVTLWLSCDPMVIVSRVTLWWLSYSMVIV